MAEVLSRTTVSVDLTLRLTLEEARALHALTVYGADGFLDVFYKHLGTSYLKPHEKGLRSAFATFAGGLDPIIEHGSKVEGVFQGHLEAIRPDDLKRLRERAAVAAADGASRRAA